MAIREKRGNVHKKARQEEEYQKIAAIVVASINAGQSKSAESEDMPEEAVMDNWNNKALGRRNEQMACSSITTYDYNSTAINLHDTQEIRCELDSHADTCVVGANKALFGTHIQAGSRLKKSQCWTTGVT